VFARLPSQVPPASEKCSVSDNAFHEKAGRSQVGSLFIVPCGQIPRNGHHRRTGVTITDELEWPSHATAMLVACNLVTITARDTEASPGREAFIPCLSHRSNFPSGSLPVVENKISSNLRLHPRRCSSGCLREADLATTVGTVFHALTFTPALLRVFH